VAYEHRLENVIDCFHQNQQAMTYSQLKNIYVNYYSDIRNDQLFRFRDELLEAGIIYVSGKVKAPYSGRQVPTFSLTEWNGEKTPHA